MVEKRVVGDKVNLSSAGTGVYRGNSTPCLCMEYGDWAGSQCPEKRSAHCPPVARAGRLSL